MRTDDELYKLCFPEHTAETLDFWWYGRQGIHRWAVPIEPASIDLTQYDRATICLHIWAFTLTAPVRSFCHNRYPEIKEADYILVHHYENAAQELDTQLGIYHTQLRSIRCRERAF